MNPAQFHAIQHPWCFFVTLTFAGKVPPSGLAFALQRRWQDSLTRILRTESDQLDWLSREEFGEANGRRHLHVLLGGVSDAARVNERSCLALMSQWEACTKKRLGMAGMARCRVFQPNLQGVGYVLKGLGEVREWSLRGANTYELGKFSDSPGRTVRLARRLLVSWAYEKGYKYGQQTPAKLGASSVKFVQV